MKKLIQILFIIPMLTLSACGQSNKKEVTKNNDETMGNVINKPNNPYYSNTDTKKLNV